MAAPMDMSLEDIIKSNKSYNDRTRGRGRGRGAGRGGGFSRGSVGAFRRVRNNNFQATPYRNMRQRQTQRDNNGTSAFDEDAVWEHDMFQEVEEEEILEETQNQRRGGALSIETGTKISIENLEYSVSEENLRDLFESVGAVKKVIIKYDKSGRSLGAAEITFSRKADAQSALNKYQGAKVDGKAIRLSVLGSNLATGGRRNFTQNRNSQRGRRGAETGFTVSLGGARKLRVGGNRPQFRRGGRRGSMRMDME